MIMRDKERTDKVIEVSIILGVTILFSALT